MMALAMIVTLSQCKKQNEENEDNTAKVRISCTIPLNNDGKTDFTNILENGTVNWSAETERIYLAIPATQETTQELVELTSETAAGGSTLTFSGNVTAGSLDITGKTKYEVWYLGRSQYSKLVEGSITGSIATQSGNLSDLGYHHIAKATVTASEGNNGGIVLSIGTFKNQIAIIKLGEESASTSILRGNAIIGTEYNLEYDGDKYDIAITGEKSINVTNPTNESYVVLFPNEETNVELKSNSSKKVTFLNGIKAGGIYTVGWEDYEEETNTINGHEYVDLGLPSGLLWATCNVGATSPEEYGDYFAWGETSTKSEYTQANSLTYGKSLNDISGNPQYDAATANWGEGWRMPTTDEQKELMFNCNLELTSINGVDGWKLTSNKNDNYIFLPLTGEISEELLTDEGVYGHFWSSTPTNSEGARQLDIDDIESFGFSGYERCCGLTIRPVSGGNFEEPEEQPEEPETPDNNGHEYVDLGLPSGLLWATCNVGANTPEAYGDYFAWGETETKSEYTEENCPTYGLSILQLQSQGYIDGEGNLTPQYDAAAANWGGDWRMPTKDEVNELRNNCTCTWTTQNSVNGYNVEGPNGNSIFLPAAGNRDGSLHAIAGSNGYYWSSTPYDGSGDRYAYFLLFSSDIQDMTGLNRRLGSSVRPVIKKQIKN